ncbi:uncharacterized protein BYT42DRAFT_496411 [Radiomyces spectabilis]|uniref:uncharacterized protein n=1 Tax=Radiomyces spectabilis TaxID=64574 RepID=UPI00221EF373|nr:uncharacterized protein BYT42DRAFT_496411 [Radiomyces spectabilis]KAI8379375.1 hypothetical protein BYT42DRAFT_496411 [Radiomyces spectabilis]
MATAKTFFETGRKIVAIGRNYSEHAKELGNAIPKAPFFFLKPTSSYVANDGTVEIPTGCEVHHEVELAVVIGKNGRDIQASEAMDYVAGYALSIDMTARNMQAEAKKKGLPWSASKGFDTFTPISSFIAKEQIPDPANVDLWLKIDGNVRQQGNTRDMMFSVPTLIEYVSSIMKLETGDVILTGTPKGVGPIHAGETITAGLKPGCSQEELVTLKFNVADRQGKFRYE